MKSDLLTKTCKPCKPGSNPLSAPKLKLLTPEFPHWTSKGKEISRTFKFKNYYETMALVNAIAYISHREDHHPDMEVGYNELKVKYSTHAVGGLSENDFICAAKVDALA